MVCGEASLSTVSSQGCNCGFGLVCSTWGQQFPSPLKLKGQSFGLYSVFIIAKYFQNLHLGR